jgi:predicted MFS family arabinose efflux permease
MPAAAWIVVLSAAASVSLSLGARQTFGLFLLPLSVEHAIPATVLGASVAIHNLVWGLGQPFAGAMADRFGTGRVALGGAGIYAVGLLLPALFPGTASLLIGIGLLTGLGTAAAGAGTVLGAVARAVPAHRRGDALGLASAGGSVGQAAMVPFAQWGIETGGTSFAFTALAATMLLALVICPRLEWRAPAATGVAPAGLGGLPALARRALADRGFALLTLGFFACGFQLAFLTVHLPAHLALCGLPAGVGVTALMLIGLFNIPGSWLCGRLGNVVRPELALGAIYLLRTVCVAIFAATTPTEGGTLVFAAVMGFIWLGTVPLTSTAIARRFGVTDLGALYGVCFLSHQVGGFLGAGAAAFVVEATGSYAAFWPVMLAVGVVAIASNWGIRAPRVAAA